MKVAVPLVKNILAPLGITAAASAIDAGIQKEIHGSGCPSSTKLMISNRKMNDIMKIVQALQDANILLKRVNKTIKMKQKKKRRILKHIFGYFRSQFVWKFINRKRNCKSRFWSSFFELLYFVCKQRSKRICKSWLL